MVCPDAAVLPGVRVLFLGGWSLRPICVEEMQADIDSPCSVRDDRSCFPGFAGLYSCIVRIGKPTDGTGGRDCGFPALWRGGSVSAISVHDIGGVPVVTPMYGTVLVEPDRDLWCSRGNVSVLGGSAVADGAILFGTFSDFFLHRV